MVNKMRWTYDSYEEENSEFFPYYISLVASQTMKDSEHSVTSTDSQLPSQTANKESDDALNFSLELPFNYDVLLKMRTEILKNTSHLIHEILTLVITDLMTLMKNNLPDLFKIWQTAFKAYTIKFDIHKGK